MTSKKNVPDAWDDDWVNSADTASSTPADPTPAETATSKKLSKSERRARQAEFNRKIWEEAEAENPTYFVSSRTDVPLQSSFKPNVTLLSRKAAAPTTGSISLAKKDSVSASAAGISGLSVQDDDDDDEEEAGKPKVLTAEERALQAQKERDEKQRRYDEARERLFGSGSTANTGTTAGTISPLRSNTPVRNGLVERGRGRSRGGGGGPGAGAREVKDAKDGRDSRPGSSMSGSSKQLFEPGYAAKPDSIYLQRREAAEAGAAASVEEQVIRAPRGPNGNGKGFVRKPMDPET